MAFRLNKTEMLAAALAVIVAITWIDRAASNKNKDGEWHRESTETAGKVVMVRWTGVAWEYRKMTSNEEKALADETALFYSMDDSPRPATLGEASAQ